MGLAWLTTLPLAGVVGALMWFIGHAIGGWAGSMTVFLLMCAAALYMRWHSKKSPIGHHNVNDDWDADATSDTQVHVSEKVH